MKWWCNTSFGRPELNKCLIWFWNLLILPCWDGLRVKIWKKLIKPQILSKFNQIPDLISSLTKQRRHFIKYSIKLIIITWIFNPKITISIRNHLNLMLVMISLANESINIAVKHEKSQKSPQLNQSTIKCLHFALPIRKWFQVNDKVMETTVSSCQWHQLRRKRVSRCSHIDTSFVLCCLKITVYSSHLH